MKYAFIRAHREEFGVRAMCRVLRVHFSGFYAWLKEPFSHRAQEDARQTELIRQAWAESGKVYGYRKLTDDLRDQGERISENRVARLASLAGIAAQVGYRRRPGRYGGKPAVVAENRLEQRFEASRPDQVWVTDITYIKTHEGWLYLSVVINLFSRRVVGWSAQSRMTTDLALQALLMAVWRRKPMDRVTVHSDRECHELCVSGLAHAGFRYGHALKRSSNIMAKWLRAANHSRTFRPPFSKLRIAK